MVKKYTVSLVVFWLAGSVLFASPAGAVASAAGDIVKLPPEARPYTRYLADWTVPKKDKAEFSKFLAVHVNKLSRGPELIAPVPVAPGLWRIDTRDYEPLKDKDLNFKLTWEKFKDIDPHFHAFAKVADPGAPRKLSPGGLPIPRRKTIITGAPWVDGKHLALLVAETQSEVPIIRADWFFRQTAVQNNRKAGYYDFLKLKKRDDFFNLIGLDKAKAQKQGREIASVVRKSGVVSGNRQVFRLGAVDTGSWVTFDVFEESTKKRNAIRNLDADFDHDAEEWYGFLPNRLFAYYLSDKNGVQQNNAPDKLGITDTSSTSNDGRIQIYLSCVRCHVEGIRPIADYTRRLYRGNPIRLQDENYERLRRLRLLYLSNLERFVRRDTEDYTDTLQIFVGLKPQDVAKLYKKFWKLSNDDDVTLEMAAVELGVPLPHLLFSLKAFAKATGSLDPVVAGYLLDPPEPVLRDQFEEVYGLLQATVRGYVPPP